MNTNEKILRELNATAKNKTYVSAEEFPSTMSIAREDYTTYGFRQLFQACNKHYGYKARVDGGWKFFEFENDFVTWKNQK
jgi:hypothetical protein